MTQIHLNYNSVHMEKENAFSMIHGFWSGSKEKKCCIFTAHKLAKSMQMDFENYPKLITIKSAKPRNEYSLSYVGQSIQDIGFDYKYNYIAILDTIYYLKSNDLDMWKDVCRIGNGLFEQWDALAPYNSVYGKQDPMILFLRIAKIDTSFNKHNDLVDRQYYWSLNKDNKVKIVDFVLHDDDFFDTQQRLEDIIDPYLKRKAKCNNINKNSRPRPYTKKSQPQNPANTSQNSNENQKASKLKSILALKVMKKEAGIDAVCGRNRVNKDDLIEWINTIENNSHKLFETSKTDPPNIDQLEQEVGNVIDSLKYVIDKFQFISQELYKLRNNQ